MTEQDIDKLLRLARAASIVPITLDHGFLATGNKNSPNPIRDIREQHRRMESFKVACKPELILDLCLRVKELEKKLAEAQTRIAELMRENALLRGYGNDTQSKLDQTSHSTTKS